MFSAHVLFIEKKKKNHVKTIEEIPLIAKTMSVARLLPTQSPWHKADTRSAPTGCFAAACFHGHTGITLILCQPPFKELNNQIDVTAERKDFAICCQATRLRSQSNFPVGSVGPFNNICMLAG